MSNICWCMLIEVGMITQWHPARPREFSTSLSAAGVWAAIFPRVASARRRGLHNLSDAAFERTFERDKDELRSLGVPIEVGSFDPLFDDEPGYRILSSEFALPAIDLDAEEAAVVGVAARVWRHASMAEATRSAIAKLRAAGVEPDASQLAPGAIRSGIGAGL